jgi:hypothetical protein
MKKLKEILKNNYWIIPENYFSEIEVAFLKNFFKIKRDFSIDEETLIEKRFLILEKKEKYLGI